VSEVSREVKMEYRSILCSRDEGRMAKASETVSNAATQMDVYFSADIETDGPIPGPFSMLSFALVFAGASDGEIFTRPKSYSQSFYREVRPISNNYEIEALRVNGIDRDRLCREGEDPHVALTEAAQWVREVAGQRKPVLVAYPLSFDWSWLYWYFVRFSASGSPFNHSLCFDMKTAYAVKAHVPISSAGKSKLLPWLRPTRTHTHNALDDAIEQAEIFANILQWEQRNGGTS
jgi:Exonuclease